MPERVTTCCRTVAQELPVTAENGQTVRLLVNRHPHRDGAGFVAWSLSGHLVEP